MKTCRGCLAAKPAGDFYLHPEMADGRLNYCKECVRARVQKRARTNPAVQEYDRKRSKLPERRAHIRFTVQNWRKANPEKYRAHSAVSNAIRDGKLRKGVCEDCGSANVHAHHDDYGKPLEVRWLCARHHHRRHADKSF